MGKMISLNEILSAGYTAGWEEIGRGEVSATNVTIYDGKYSLLCKATVGKTRRIWAVGRDADLEPGEFSTAKLTFVKLSDGVNTIFKVDSVVAVEEA